MVIKKQQFYAINLTIPTTQNEKEGTEIRVSLGKTT